MQTAHTQACTKAHTCTCKETKTKLNKLHALVWLSVHLLVVYPYCLSMNVYRWVFGVFFCDSNDLSLCDYVMFFKMWIKRFKKKKKERERETETDREREKERERERERERKRGLLFIVGQSISGGSRSPQGFSQVKFRTQVENNTKHAHYTNVKHTNVIQKVVPSVSLS